MNTLAVPPEAQALCQRVAALIDAGRTATARPLLAAARAMVPDGVPVLALLSARISLQEGEYQAALRQLDDALARSPGDAPLHKCRAEVFQRLHNGEAAARDAAEAVVLDPADAEAKAALGTALLGLGRTRDAVACLNEALAAEPGVIPWREALATALEAEEDVDTALRVLADGVTLAPDNVGLRNAAILVCLRRRDFRGAVQLAEEARLAGIADACTFGMKGHALASMHDHDGASAAYQEALKLGPDDAYVRHLVMAAGALPSAMRAPADYVATVFDGYADRFESHLISLGYTTPVRMRELLAAHPTIQDGDELGPVLDLGCGTGLVALALSDLRIGPLTGVDLSAGMLRHARAKGLYAELRQDDILAALTADSPERWALILAADAFVYFGALEEVFAAVRERLAPGGWFVCSLEELTPPDTAWALHRLGRYAHTAEYVQRVIDGTGLRLLRCDRKAMRREGGAPVPGLLIVAERPHHDH